MAPTAVETSPAVPAAKQAAETFPKKKTTSGYNTLGHAGSTVPLDDEVLPEVLTGHREPLQLSGALDQYEQFDVTPVIGREFVNVNLVDLLRAPNSDELIQDLAITSKHHSSDLSL